MKPDYEQRLEKAISDKLRSLPELSAPDRLAAKVMSTLAARAALPWYRRPWQNWSPALQTASFLLLLMLFGGLCFAGWKVSEANNLAKAIPEMGEWFSTLGVIRNTLGVLAEAALLALKQLGPIFLLVCAASAACSYAICVGLGTVIYRQVQKINYEN